MPQLKWGVLNKRQREQVVYMLGALEEFHLGVTLLEDINEKTPQGATPHRFMMNALYFYAASFFLANGNNLVRLLNTLGHEDVAAPASEILERPLGQSSLREVLTLYRNHFLSHPQYSYTHVEKKLKPKFDLNVRKNADLFAERNSEFFNAVVEMRVPLSQRFPEAFEQTSIE